MATHSNIFAWRIPWTEETGGLQSMGCRTVRQDLVTKQQQCTCLIKDFKDWHSASSKIKNKKIVAQICT